MEILVDTRVWSMALRRSDAADVPEATELMAPVGELPVQLRGPVRQEILPGIQSIDRFTKLRDHLRPFLDLELITGDFESAAEFYNLCRGKGVQGSNTNRKLPWRHSVQRLRCFRTRSNGQSFSEGP